MGFLENLKSELEYQDISIKELAGKASIAKNTLDNYFSGPKSIPKADTAVKIAEALGVSVVYLVTGKDSAKPETLPPEIRDIINMLKNMQSYDVKIVRELCKMLYSR